MRSSCTTSGDRRIALAAVITLAALTGCSDSPTVASTPLDAILTATEATSTSATGDVAVAGDSVIVTITEPNTCGYDEGATAQRQNGTLDVTVVLSAISAEAVALCDPEPGSTQYRVTVGPVPAGSYSVAGHYRLVVGTDVHDAIVTSRTLSLP
jgi:hypothetical protein